MSTLILAAAISLAPGAAAFAHGDDGAFSGTEAVPTDGDSLTVSLRARLLYASDDEPAPGATVTVDAVDASGGTVPPASLTDNGDGTYQGALVLTAAGMWTLRFTATTPNAATEAAYTAESQATAPLTSVPPTTTRAGRGGADDDGNGTGVLVLAVMAAAAVLAAGWLLWRRRH